MSHQVQANVVSDKQMEVAEAAFVAGVIEGEGTIGLAVRGRSGYRDSVTPMLKVANTNLALLERLVEATGNGAIWQKNLSSLAHRLCYDWTLTANQIRHILPQIQPYLYGKRRQAELVIEYLGMVRGHLGVAPEDWARSIEIREELAQLNRRGGTEAERQATRVQFGKQECSTEGCSQRRYRGHEVCYHHWLETREVRTGHCEHCKAEMEIRDARKRFCSTACQLAHWDQTVAKPKREKIAAARPPVPCQACEKPIDQTGYAGKKFCDDHCYSVWRARQKKLPEGFILTKECAACGKSFETKWNKQAYCSSACTKKAYRDRLRQTE